MLRHVADAGLKVLNSTDLASRADVVVVAGTTSLVYDDLRDAVQAVLRGADLLATARDPTYPQPDGLWPGTGAILAAVEYASGVRAQIVGKPEPQLFLTALDRLGDGKTLVIGDRVGSDLAAAAAAQLDAALVRSDSSDHDELEGFDPQPVAVADTLAGLLVRPS
jgi:ribonucleotide monophosphatase NagD (HAD superfamily)